LSLSEAEIAQFAQKELQTIEKMKTQQMTKAMSQILGQDDAKDDFDLVQKQLDKLIPLVSEANIAATELKRNIRFKTKLEKKFNHFLKKEKVYPIVQVENFEGNYTYEWTEFYFKNRLHRIRELLEERQQEGASGTAESSEDPFWDPPQPVAIGQAMLPLESLAYGLEASLTLPVSSSDDANSSEEQLTTIKLSLQPCASNGSTDPADVPDQFLVDDHKKLIGLRDLCFKVAVESAAGLPPSLSQEPCVQYQVGLEQVRTDYWTEKVPGVCRDPTWNHSHVHRIPVITESIADQLLNGHITFTLYAV